MIQKSSYLLAIETVGKVCGIAIIDAKNGSLQLEYVIHVPNMHDAMLAELIRRAMNDLHIQPEHLQVIAVLQESVSECHLPKDGAQMEKPHWSPFQHFMQCLMLRKIS